MEMYGWSIITSHIQRAQIRIGSRLSRISAPVRAFEATKKKLDAGAYKAEKIPDMAEKV